MSIAGRPATGPDRRHFRPDAIPPETTAANAELARTLAGAPPVYAVPPAEHRTAVERGEGAGRSPIVRLEQAVNRSISGPGGRLTLRVLRPETARGVYLHIHGGGWVYGDAEHQDQRLWDLASASDLAIVSVQYRLAPEHPYPAGPDDCEAAALWLAAHSESELGVRRLMIGGDSAGAHLAAVTLLRMRDRHGFADFAAANLAYGVYDLTGTPSAIRATGSLVIDIHSMAWFSDRFVPPELRSDPDVSPLGADLRDMPSALFTVGTLDPLLDDSLFMHQRSLAAGNESELAVYPGGVHGFDTMPTAQGRQATTAQHAFLRAAAHGAT